MNGKQFVIASLFAIALLTLVFTPLAQQQSGGAYDPWLDYNEDGKIDVSELQLLGQGYGTSGDTAKNVTIAKLASKVCYKADIEVEGGSTSWYSPFMSIKGYSKVTILIIFEATLNAYTLFTCDDTHDPNWIVDSVGNFPTHFVKTYDAMNQEIFIQIFNGDGPARMLHLEVYLVP